MVFFTSLSELFPELSELQSKERLRLSRSINLIASENIPSFAVLEAASSLFTVKYAEGYPGRRYYGGCEIVDQVEKIAKELAQNLFGVDHANVQPHSGAQANQAVFETALADWDRILSLSLDHGGHLTHGHKVNFSGRRYSVFNYTVDRKTHLIDMDEVEFLAQKHRPKLIIAGASAYSRAIDFKRFKEIANRVGARLLADVSHYSGLICAGLYPSPSDADFITTTTHKTLRGPRSGIVMCKNDYADAIDRAVFPLLQGGPHMHTIFAKAVCFKIAQTEQFRLYAEDIVKNAKKLAEELQKRGFEIVSGGTDCHMFLVDLRNLGVDGRTAQQMLENVGIYVNKNMIPYDPLPPTKCSGIRIGTPLITSLGAKEDSMPDLADLIEKTLKKSAPQEALKKNVREFVAERLPLSAYVSESRF